MLIKKQTKGSLDFQFYLTWDCKGSADSPDRKIVIIWGAVYMRKIIPPRRDVSPKWHLGGRMVYLTLQKQIIYMKMDSFHPVEISRRWDDFSPWKQLFPGCQPRQDCSFSLGLACFSSYYVKKYNSSYKI